MSMLLIEGEYRLQGAAPDGDSIRFYPDKPENWLRVTGKPVRTNKRVVRSCGIDGIDALETHYNPEGPHFGNIHQPKDLGDKASTELLHFLGFTKVVRDKNQTVTSCVPEKVPGYILTRFSDTYGRVVAFAFKGSRNGASGDEIRLNVAEMKKSWNYRALAEGFAYPTFYSKLFVDLRKEMAAASRAAREAKKGIWSKDVTYTGFALESLGGLFDKAYIVPRLWRRLTSYIEFNDGDIGLEGFKDWLATEDDRVIILPDGQVTGFDYVVDVAAQVVKLTEPLENLVYQEK